MKPTEVLKEEHEVIKIILDVLEKIVDNIVSKGQVNVNHLEKIVDFIKTFADKCHHGKEEDLLFPAMEEFGIPKDEGPIGVMLEEHDIGRNYVKKLAEAINEYKNNKNSLKDIVENASGYINLLRQHIDKENDILYMMADMHIPDKKQKILLKEFEKVEEKMGKGVHEKYHHLAEELRDEYLKKNKPI
ncbi:MAG: hemerythrin domain-containing protein [Candidatus Omnitrophica bacterium]|nr:hemerythrin domain-containing protein [Candidatus Omnitrophota bacterium]MCM8802601.1 hemerythrin domain-containing protein [Candidatus Omnitrophota bacterium]